MRRTSLNFDKFYEDNLPRIAAVAVFLAVCLPTLSQAQQPGQKTFSSAEDASKALVAAAQSNDEKAMLEILGSDGKEIVSSGDDAEDAESRANFVKRYEQMHRLVKEPDETTILYIGAHNWPTPIPLMRKGSVWYFDTDAGKKEILYRRVGRNEMSAIRVCQELVAAQKEYSAEHGGEYAQKIYSDKGQHNGLYWKPSNGEPHSPIGPLVAAAVTAGYAKDQEAPPTPFRGYYFHILVGQKNGPGGAKSYIVNGKMTDGFAFIAYPAEYRSSGVMSFAVNQDGVVYEKDLGKKTEAVAKTMKQYDPASGWQKTEEMPEQTASAQSK
jgi:hypothetical protein